MDQRKRASSNATKSTYVLPSISSGPAMGTLKHNKSTGSTTEGRDRHKGPLVLCFGELLINFVPMVAGVSLAEAKGLKKSPGAGSG
ncbi:hypothetical protein L6452_34232 [Arctium lappa]|uniref:Uncharacterized protein n=1 Tax=Arctium lappa TaxID=4217 RepID=A0ACB8YIT1_ARCLA|nr:hypothetical protein L6452_34232 [Arctium lappa]